MMSKTTLKYLTNILFFAVILYLIVQRVPGILEAHKRQGELAPPAEVTSLEGERLTIPLQKKHVLVFWATWCGPCGVELARINRLVKNGALAPDSVLAISIGEAKATVEAHMKEHGYLFRAALDPGGRAGREYQVAGTPTILLVREDGIVEWMTVGVSPTLELRLHRFFN
ncbi:MAG TPA: TlpA disulfide reductase family protein [Bdellovibrionales bacterium]|nr:TlpA disulfide reductase family protein [Bdellovibrionales bacterium]